MKHPRAAALVIALTLPGAAVGHGEPEPAQVEVTGEIVDLHCYLAEAEARGADHAACARRCLEQGQPMGLLTENGTLYVLSAHHTNGAAFDAAKRLAGQAVDVTGVPLERDGVKGLEVHRVGKRR